MVSTAPDALGASQFLTALLGSAGTVRLCQIVEGGKDSPSETFDLPMTERDMQKFLALAEDRNASVYFIPNEGGREDDDIGRIRACFVDMDEPEDLATFDAKLAAFGCQPSSVVETSRNRRQVFWALTDCPVEQFRPLQKALASHFGTDSLVSNPARLMRLPYSRNAKLKHNGFIADELAYSEAHYSAEEVWAALGSEPETWEETSKKPLKRNRTVTPIADADSDSLSTLERMAAGDGRKRRDALSEQRQRLGRALWVLARAGYADGHETWQPVCASILACAEPQEYRAANGKDCREIPALLDNDEACQLVHEFSRCSEKYDEAEVERRLDAGLGGDRAGCGLPRLEVLAQEAQRVLRDAGVPPSETEPPGFLRSSEQDRRATAEAVHRRMQELRAEQAERRETETNFASTAHERRAAETSVGERRLALLFIARHRRDLRRVAGSARWLRWYPTEHRWRGIDGEAVLALVSEAAQENFEATAEAYARDPEDRDARNSYRDAVAMVSSAARIRGALALAAGSGALMVAPDRLDGHAHILPVKNGALNLQRGHFRAGTPEDFSTRQAGCEWRPDAECPTWLRFLDETFGADRELIDWLQIWVGYLLTGSVDQEALLFCYGSGANGKSLFGDTLHALLGELARPVSPDLIVRTNNESAGERAKTALAGIRLGQVNELGVGALLDDAAVKSVCSYEAQSIRRLYAEAETVRPTAKIIVRSNVKPAVHDRSEGLWRRLKLIPFVHTVPPERRDHQLGAKLRAELPGILRWAAEGARKYYALRGRPIPDPEVVRAASAAYRRDSDTLADFLREETEVTPNASTPLKQMYRRYRGWAEEEGLRPMSGKAFGRAIEERGYPLETGHARHRNVVGLRLRDRSSTASTETTTAAGLKPLR